MSFFAAVLILGEKITLLAVASMLLIVCGIVLVAGMFRGEHRAPRAGVFFGLGTGCFIAAYTVNDGWAVKTLALSPFIIDFAGTVSRVVILTPFALRDRQELLREARMYSRPAAVVSVLGPLCYVLVLFAMRIAPVSHVAPARELSTLVGTYFGSRLLREAAAPARLVGATCILIGVVSLAFAQ